MASYSALLLLAIALGSSAIQAVTIPQSPSSNASALIRDDYIGFALECASFPNFTANDFSLNMFSVFSRRSRGSQINLRLGGTSQDVSSWHPEQKMAITRPDGDSQGLNSPLWIGQAWMAAFGKIANTRYELEIPFATKNETNGVAFLKAAIQSMGQQNLYTIEVGNEPNLYPPLHRPKGYNSSTYITELHQYQSVLQTNVPFIQGKTIFRNLDLSWGYNPSGAFDVVTALQQGLNSNKNTAAISLHYYAADNSPPPMSRLLSISAQESATDVFKSSINYIKQRNLNIPVILGEVGDVLGNVEASQSSSLGAAVWAADWLLYTMSIGIDRVNLQQLTGASFNLWQPADDPSKNDTAGVKGPFYGTLMIADLINATTQGLRVEQLDSGSPNVTLYSAYNGGKPHSALLFNHQLWTRDDGVRPNATVTLDIGNVKQATVRRLIGPGALATDNITWAGQEWEYPSGQAKTVGETGHVITPNNGMVKIQIPASSGCEVVFN